MGTTTNYSFRYPAAAAANNVPTDIEHLAEDVDAELKTIHDGLAGTIPALDATASDITASNPGDTAAAGSTGKAADAGHRHPRETSATALVGTADLTTYQEVLVSLGSMGASKALDLSAGRSFAGTLSANCTVSFSNIPATANRRISWSIKVKQASSGGPYNITWPAAVDWGVTGTPTITTLAGKADFISFVTDDAGVTVAGFVGTQGATF